MRFAIDTGGTFTDLVLDDGEGGLQLFKSATTPEDPSVGVLAVLGLAAESMGLGVADLLAQGEYLLHATTHPINALLTGSTARTAFLATEGHRDILLLREGGRANPYDNTREFPAPFVPRELSFGLRERVGPTGQVEVELDEGQAVATLGELSRLGVEAVGVCLLWSIANPVHEQRVGALLDEHLPGVPYTLSHELNPTLREYRRASSACIDASLKPLMSRYLDNLEGRLRDAGFGGRLLVVTSTGGVMDAGEVAAAPIHAINSGPSMAPVAGHHYGATAESAGPVVIADTGGTSFDVSVVRRGRIPSTRETWIGEQYVGHLTGFPSVDVKSVGAGGGSIAWVDSGGLLHVGPESAGSTPGPVCYGRGGTRPTVTDACLVLGHLDPHYFLGGRMTLDLDGARAAIAREVGGPLGLDVEQAANAIRALTTERMVGAVEEITVNQGIDPSSASIVAGGGAAGLNIVAIARRLGARRVVIPEVAATLSAAGALIADLANTFFETHVINTAAFDAATANAVLDRLAGRASAFIASAGVPRSASEIDVVLEARYPGQIWEIEVPLPAGRFADDGSDVAAFADAFHGTHREIFAISDDASPVEIVGWRTRATCRLRSDAFSRIVDVSESRVGLPRRIVLPNGQAETVDVHTLESLVAGVSHRGPAIVESSFTTVVVDGPWSFGRGEDGTLVVDLDGATATDPSNAHGQETQV